MQAFLKQELRGYGVRVLSVSSPEYIPIPRRGANARPRHDGGTPSATAATVPATKQAHGQAEADGRPVLPPWSSLEARVDPAGRARVEGKGDGARLVEEEGANPTGGEGARLAEEEGARLAEGDGARLAEGEAARLAEREGANLGGWGPQLEGQHRAECLEAMSEGLHWDPDGRTLSREGRHRVSQAGSGGGGGGACSEEVASAHEQELLCAGRDSLVVFNLFALVSIG